MELEGRVIECIHCLNLLEGHIWENKYHTTCSLKAERKLTLHIIIIFRWVLLRNNTFYTKMPQKKGLNLLKKRASSQQLGSRNPHPPPSTPTPFTDAVKLTGVHLFCRVACFSLPPFHVYAAVMIINRNIKASGAILVCDKPHTLVSTTVTCRCHGNAGDVIMSPHSAVIESHCMSSSAYIGNVTCWLLYQLFASYIRKESPLERERARDREKALQNPPTQTLSHTQIHTRIFGRESLVRW